MNAPSIKVNNGKTRPKKKRLMILALTMLALGVSLGWNLIFPPKEPEIISLASRTDPSASAAESAGDSTGAEGLSDPIPIYLVGAVNKPGVYLVERGSYLYKLVDQAGGLTDNAAADCINLALSLDVNQLIRIPTREEAEADPARWAGEGPTAAAGKIDLNRADETQLDSLPGIGPSTARAIVEYRAKNGSFQSVEDLMKVPGIKESRYNALKELVTVNIRG